MIFGKKAQTSIELLIIIGILFALFSFALYIGNQKSSTIKYQEQAIEAKSISRFLGNTINTINIMPNGTEKLVVLKKKYDYTFAIHNYGLHLIIPESNSYFDYPLTTNNVDFNATDYDYISIKKTDNIIVINDAE